MLLVALAFAYQVVSEAAPRNVLTLADARFTIPEVVGQVIRVRDCNGDGKPDLFIARGKERGRIEHIDLVSGKDGSSIRTVWTQDKKATREPAWDAGGDADGDGYPDLVLGNRWAASNCGEVVAISGKTGSVLVKQSGGAEQRLGATVCWIGDGNRDGHDDFAASSLACDLDGTIYALERRQGSPSSPSVARDLMKEKCQATGYVTLYSGSDGSTLWNASGTAPGAAFGSVMSLASDLDEDGARDLIVQADLHAGLPASLLSGKTGKVLSTLDTLFGPVVSVRDVDADGSDDFVLARMDERIFRYAFSSQVISGKTRAPLFWVKHPDDYSTHAQLVGLGDLDGDGHGEIGIGDVYFCVHEDMPRSPAPDLRKARLGEMTGVESIPRGGNLWESGCVVVYSGKTQQPIFGVWAEYGSQTGLGFEVIRVDDINADGRDDLLVTGQDTAYVFATPPFTR